MTKDLRWGGKRQRGQKSQGGGVILGDGQQASYGSWSTVSSPAGSEAEPWHKFIFCTIFDQQMTTGGYDFHQWQTSHLTGSSVNTLVRLCALCMVCSGLY